MDISNITDIDKLKAIRGDCYQERENATAVVQQSNENIRLVNARIEEVEANTKKPSPKTPKEG